MENVKKLIKFAAIYNSLELMAEIQCSTVTEILDKNRILPVNIENVKKLIKFAAIYNSLELMAEIQCSTVIEILDQNRILPVNIEFGFKKSLNKKLGLTKYTRELKKYIDAYEVSLCPIYVDGEQLVYKTDDLLKLVDNNQDLIDGIERGDNGE